MNKKDMYYSYNDLSIGDQFISPSRTIAEYDLVQFAGLTGDYNELHTSKLFAESTPFGKQIAHGMLILSIANGLYTRCNIFKTSVFLGIENWKSTKPVMIHDTIKLRITIAGKRVTKDGKRGIIKMKYEVLNQFGEIVGEGMFNRMIGLE
ncbi:MaoC/PaaZ C-terminal domain-containing protein [Acidaminococcus massiliensis]|jgi:3-hydroxybutyryl-CoA dehydratase|uniref:MaoC/PaaZ C-terminal domain-containing protein n=1 Tax=Acidaminococcus massiliensis TaxID=1852375 RepID=UPI0022E5EDAE|nr:MaoC/PaaZ C-terminal domain-containing protein [Acidaminococcus massiliensis]